MASLFDLGLQGYNFMQMNDALGDARSDINAGAAQARSDITTYQQPYQNYGLESIGNVQDRGDFNFSFGNYLDSDNYKWLLDQGLQGVARTNAPKTGFFSGNTLTDLTKYGQNFAQAQYQQEWLRQHEGYKTNTSKDLAGIRTGAETAQSMGQNLADLSIGTANARAGLEYARANAISKQLNALTDLGQVGGVAGTTMDPSGNIINQAGDIISNIWDGGGLDGQGNWGLIGDIGGFLSGNFGSSYSGFSPSEYSGMFAGNTNADGTPFYDPGQDFWEGADSGDWWDDFTTSLSQGWDSIVSWADDFFG